MNYEKLPEETEALAASVVDAAYKVYSTLGPGLLESAYQTCLEIELQNRNVKFSSQHNLPVIYEGRRVEPAYRIDLFIDARIVVELKAVEQFLPLHTAQILTYLKLSGLRLGLLLNFDSVPFKNGIKRVIR